MSDDIVNTTSATNKNELERPNPKASYDVVYRYALQFCEGNATKATSFCRGWFSVGRDDLNDQTNTNNQLINKEETQNDRPKSSSIKRKTRTTKAKQE